MPSQQRHWKTQVVQLMKLAAIFVPKWLACIMTNIEYGDRLAVLDYVYVV